MIAIEQLRYVRLGTRDLAGAAQFAQRILGLELVEQDRPRQPFGRIFAITRWCSQGTSRQATPWASKCAIRRLWSGLQSCSPTVATRSLLVPRRSKPTQGQDLPVLRREGGNG